MTAPWSVFMAGALIAATILITNHWQIGVAPGQVYRLDRWTGRVVSCNSSDMSMFLAGTNIPCERP